MPLNLVITNFGSLIFKHNNLVLYPDLHFSSSYVTTSPLSFALSSFLSARRILLSHLSEILINLFSILFVISNLTRTSQNSVLYPSRSLKLTLSFSSIISSTRFFKWLSLPKYSRLIICFLSLKKIISFSFAANANILI